MQKLNKVTTRSFDFVTGEETKVEIDLEEKNAIIDDNGEVVIFGKKGMIKTTLENLKED